MRIVRDREDLLGAVRQAKQEAEGAFRRGDVYLEKFIENPRHVEVQILADQHGHVIHLGERDCTVQRRYQKLIEESPSPSIESRTRRDLCAAAIKLARAANYTSAGTVEFLVDEKGKYYFIEVNTRIQVEHPVTEMVTGRDLIKEQIRIASGEELGYAQEDILIKGWAIECRINAEDPANGFKPSSGKVTRCDLPGGRGVRVAHPSRDERHPPPHQIPRRC